VAAIGQLERHARRQAPDGDGALLARPVFRIGQVGGAAGHQRFHHLAIVQLGRSDRHHQVFFAV
jgi:hypothetical protein